jgi:hypothetical protein
MDLREIDAAQALLGVSPGNFSFENGSLEADNSVERVQTQNASPEHGFFIESDAAEIGEEQPPFSGKRPRSGSAGLEALAFLAEKETEAAGTASFPLPLASSSSAVSASSSASVSSSDEEAMPPPPPRRRHRSASNPEGMERWDSFLTESNSNRRHFVLPASIIEEELAEANVAIQEQQERSSVQPRLERIVEENATTEETHQRTVSAGSSDEDANNMTPDDLLRRARSRLLEDLSAGSVNGEKGDLTLPHSLSKYKEVRDSNLCTFRPVEGVVCQGVLT